MVCHGPFAEKPFEEVELHVPNGVSLTKELVRKVMVTWIERNVTNQFLVKALAELGLGVDPLQIPLCETLKVENGGIEQLSLSVRNLQDTMKNWKSFQDEGYSVTIIN